jgi:hypothetical protein
MTAGGSKRQSFGVPARTLILILAAVFGAIPYGAVIGPRLALQA